MRSHWPDCNWCNKGATHLANGSSNDTDAAPQDNADPDSGDDNYDDYDDGSAYDANPPSDASDPWDPVDKLVGRRLLKKYDEKLARLVKDAVFALNIDLDIPLESSPVPASANVPVPTTKLLPLSTSTQASSSSLQASQQSSDKVFTRSVQGQNAVNTQSKKATTTAKQASSCTPSPTKSLAASASEFFLRPYVQDEDDINNV